jgi:hypothetical protein
MNRHLHITSGSAATDAVMAAAGCDPDALLIHHDVLSVGRLPPLGGGPGWREDWQRERLQIWAQDMKGRGADDFPRDLLEQADRLKAADEVTLWLGSALSDQLVLAFTVQLCDRIGVDAAKLSLRQEAIVGIGMLEPEELAPVDEAPPEALSADELAFARQAWAATTAPEPDQLLALLEDTVPESLPCPLPFLQAALAMFLERFADPRSGLGVWDETLMTAAASEGASARKIVWRALTERRLCKDPVGDTHLLQRLRRLGDARLPQPLLSLEGDVHDLGCEARITAAGQEVVAGRASFLGRNGAAAPLDEWVGGVLVSPAQDRLWFRQGPSLQRAPRSG